MEHKDMSYGGHFKALLVLGLPLIGGHLAQFAIGLTDTVMMGWYSVESLAAIVLGNTLFFVTFIFGSGFGIAVMPLVAEADAKGDHVQIRRVTRMGMWLSVAFAVLAIPLFWFSESLLLAIGQQPDLSAEAQAYLRIAGWGILPALLVGVLKSFLAALGHTRIVFWITVLAALVNALVNYVLIFGNFGAPELGIIGAAIASLAVNAVSIVGVILYTRRALPEHELFVRMSRIDPEALVKVFRVGMPIGLTILCETSLFAASATMMGWLGTIPLAAHGIAINVAGLTFMLHLGLASAATVRVGNALGRMDIEHLAKGARMAIWMSVGFSVAAVIMMVAFPQFLIGLFLDGADPNFDAIVEIGVTLMYLAALFQFVDGAQAMALGVLRGVQDTRVPMMLAAISYWVVGLSVGYGLGFGLEMGGVGVWLGLVAGLATAAALLMLRFWNQIIGELRRKAAKSQSYDAEPSSA